MSVDGFEFLSGKDGRTVRSGVFFSPGEFLLLIAILSGF